MTLIAGHEHSVSNQPGGDVKLSSLEISLRLFSPLYSTTMLIDRSGAFMASEADVSQTGVKSQCFDVAVSYATKILCRQYPLENIDLISK